MALLERVATLIRANINDLIDKAEDPEKTLKLLVLDMENQLLQVKTQLAIAIADQHLLEKKQQEHAGAVANWQQKAALAVHKQQDDLARAALARSLSHRQMADNFAQQLEDQRVEAESLRSAYGRLQQKLTETRARCEILLARNRRARMVGKATRVRQLSEANANSKSLDRFQSRILGQEATNHAANSLLATDSVDDQFESLERNEQIDLLLKELKENRLLSA